MNQTDYLITIVVEVLEGVREVEIVRYLLRLRVGQSGQMKGESLRGETEAARTEVINIVNHFFYENMSAAPTFRAYMDSFQV